MRLKRGIKAAHWVLSVTCGIGRFMVSNPRAAPKTIRWAFKTVRAVPEKIVRKIDLDGYRAQVQERLAGYQQLFREDEAARDCADLEVLRQISSARGITRPGVLYLLVRAAHPETVVETGVAEGESTWHILQALAESGGGSLHSIDMPNQFYLTDGGEVHAEFNAPQAEPGCLVPEGLRRHWKLTLGRSCDKLEEVLREAGPIDLFYHDSEHTYETMMFEYEAAWPHIRRGGYLVSDDATWSAAFREFAERHAVGAVLIQEMGLIRKP